MPKRRVLKPESVYARVSVEEWLDDTLQVNKIHRNRIWKTLPAKDLVINDVASLPNVVYKSFHDKFVLTTTKVVDEKASAEGGKLVLETQDGHLIETVVIQHRDGKRTTVCVSSQVGCAMGCTFCATGTMGLAANLTAAEIVEQVHHARIRYPTVMNVVFMGMGEPLDNYENVKEAIFSLVDPHAFAIPMSRITLSTVGVTHSIRKLAKECPEIQLALSLHAPNDTIRQGIVPSTKAFSVAKIMEAVSLYQNNNTRSVMIEYIMIGNVNTTSECAHELGRLLSGKAFMVNLIPYNPTEVGDKYGFDSPSDEKIGAFQDIIFQYKNHTGKPLRCTVRWSSRRGHDIDAACGQLALKNFNASLPSSSSSDSKSKSGIKTAADIEDLGSNSACRSGNSRTEKNVTTTSKNHKNSDKKATFFRRWSKSVNDWIQQYHRGQDQSSPKTNDVNTITSSSTIVTVIVLGTILCFWQQQYRKK